jgi:hypothetical protein
MHCATYTEAAVVTQVLNAGKPEGGVNGHGVLAFDNHLILYSYLDMLGR